VFSQKQANFWHFGTLAGLDFNSGAPVVLNNSVINTAEGSASISDASGNLLFYTDGLTVWDKNNAVMPNGTGLFGDISTTQSAMIIPGPGSSTLYYIFTLDDEGGPNGFRYSIVDMTLNSGNGDVTTKNTFLRNNVTEKLTAVFHCNGTDIWVMMHDFNSKVFAAYLVTASGINPPVISTVGPVQEDVHGQMKFNTDGTQIACIRDTVINPIPASYQGKAFVDLFDFDKTTGVVSNPLVLSLNNHQKAYGVEFSSDNTKLYASYYDQTGINGGNSYVDQFDLSAANIQASMTSLGVSMTLPIFRALQLGPDGKIYISKANSPFLCVINSPNLAGTACNFVDDAINIDPGGMGNMCLLGLPAFIQSYFNPAFPNVPCAANANFQSSDTTICSGSCINFTDLSSGAVTSWTWTFAGAGTASSTAQNPSGICYSSAGTHTVQLVVSNGASSDTIVKSIIVVSPSINAGPDVTMSPGSSTQLNATGSVNTYTWTPATGLSSTTISNPVATSTGIGTVTYSVSGTDNNGCIAMDVVNITVEITCGDIFVPTGFSPNNDGENELECIMGNCIESLQFAIYDRWGEKVFETSDQQFCWDGIYKGKLMDSGIFVYYLKATLSNGDEIDQKGNISLVR
jgi:gliding motility-associated-like protein